MKVLVKREYHGQIWFEVEDGPRAEGLVRIGERNLSRHERRAVNIRSTSEDRSFNKRPVQSPRRLPTLG